MRFWGVGPGPTISPPIRRSVRRTRPPSSCRDLEDSPQTSSPNETHQRSNGPVYGMVHRPPLASTTCQGSGPAGLGSDDSTSLDSGPGGLAGARRPHRGRSRGEGVADSFAGVEKPTCHGHQTTWGTKRHTTATTGANNALPSAKNGQKKSSAITAPPGHRAGLARTRPSALVRWPARGRSRLHHGRLGVPSAA